MTPAGLFFILLGFLILFGWYLATDLGSRKRWLAFTLAIVALGIAIGEAWPPADVKDAKGHVITPGKIQLGLDIQGGTRFLIRLVKTDKEISKAMLDQAVEVIRKRVDQFGTSEPVITPVGTDRIEVQIPRTQH